MQPQTFELKLANATLIWFETLLVLGICALAGLVAWACLDFDNVLYIGLALVVAGGGLFLGGRALWRAAIVPARVTLTPTELRIQDQLDGSRSLTQTLQLADISTYGYLEVNGTQELRLWLNRSEVMRLRLSSPASFGNTTEFQAMVAAFEQLMRDAPPSPGSAMLSTLLPQTFELNLLDTTRSVRLVTLLILGIFVLTGLVTWAFSAFDNVLYIGLTLVGVGGGLFLGGWAWWRAALVPARVTLTPTELRIQDQRDGPSGLTQTLRLADIGTYGYSNHNYNQELRLRRNRVETPRLRLSSPLGFGSTTEFRALATAFEQLMRDAPSPLESASRRQKTFFEKPISTNLLVLWTVVVGILSLNIMFGHQSRPVSMFSIYAPYAAYLAAWRAAARRRNAS